jgi:hypothetical protein
MKIGEYPYYLGSHRDYLMLWVWMLCWQWSAYGINAQYVKYDVIMNMYYEPVYYLFTIHGGANMVIVIEELVFCG